MKIMTRSLILLAGFILLSIAARAAEKQAPAPSLAAKAKPTPSSSAELLFPAARYEGKLTDTEARFAVDLEAESVGKGESFGTLFEGDIAVPVTKLPPDLRLVREVQQYRLLAGKPA